MVNIYFRHPDIKVRSESWGGIVQTTKGVFPLDEAHYQALVGFTEYEGEEPTNPLHQTLLDMDAICRISKEEAMAVVGDQP